MVREKISIEGDGWYAEEEVIGGARFLVIESAQTDYTPAYIPEKDWPKLADALLGLIRQEDENG